MLTFKNAFFKIYQEFLLLLPKLVTALFIFFLFYLLARLVRKLVKSAMSRLSTQGNVDFVVGQVSYITILIIGAVAALSSSGLANVAALVTSLGLAGFAFGFALRDVLGNFLAGILILAHRPFMIGDQIDLAGHSGLVTDIRVRDTVIKANTGELIFIPNSTVFASIIVNQSKAKQKLTSCELILPATTNFAGVIKEAKEILSKMPGVLSKPEPKFTLEQTDVDKFKLKISYWVSKSLADPESSQMELLASLNKTLVKQ